MSSFAGITAIIKESATMELANVTRDFQVSYVKILNALNSATPMGPA